MTGLEAQYTLEYTYRRAVGPVVGRFFTSLREGRLEGQRTASGEVIVPPTGYDPNTGEALTEWVPVGPGGVVTTWAFMGGEAPFAWALVRLDGATTAMLHKVRVGASSEIRTGMRVRACFSASPVGAITDIECFEVEP